ncbi:MAG TPA: NAD(P)-dependent oxidoreductase, partial [Pirellulales bacterium]|nr:NAD(P)-dependent oxidoreductase [Pirellulales bacterium]
MSPPSLDPAQILVTGASGMVGRALSWGIKLTRGDLDVRDQDAVQQTIREMRPAAVLHLAALDIRQCEADPLAAIRTNVLGTRHVAQAGRDADIPVILLSSGAVFNGPAGTLHDENSRPDPVNIYGQSKQLAEIVLQETHENSLVVRTGWLFGGHQAHHQRFIERAIEQARRSDPILGTRDEQGSPTWIDDLEAEILRLISNGSRGIVHVVNAGIASGYDLALEIVRILDSR